MFGRYRKCYCMNNNYQDNSEQLEEMVESTFSNNCIENESVYMDCCECGFDDEKSVFPENPVLAQSYVPIQYMDKTFKPNVGLKMGTIYPELVSPYMPCQDMRENEWIASTNEIKEGCNKCQ